ncbi:MAG: glycosyltransferase family 2 protein [Verrucomicrobiales bacterium]|nr:glycosyltransferase family 2 protein [Verrucomicrobiales bacterium]
MPLVSVLTTCYKRADLLPDTIRSVLASSWEDFEYIIVDDASPDDSFKIALDAAQRDKRVKAYRNDVNLGDYPNRNKAVSLATGKYIKFVDHDDMIYSHGLRVFVESMEKFPTAGFGLSADGDGAHPYPDLLQPNESFHKHYFERELFGRAPGSAIVRLDAFRAVGGFSGRRFIGDAELWFKLAARFPLVRLVRDLTWDRSTGDEKESVMEARNSNNQEVRIQFTFDRILENQFLSSQEKELVIKQYKKELLKAALYKSYKQRSVYPLSHTLSLIKKARLNAGAGA